MNYSLTIKAGINNGNKSNIKQALCNYLSELLEWICNSRIMNSDNYPEEFWLSIRHICTFKNRAEYEIYLSEKKRQWTSQLTDK